MATQNLRVKLADPSRVYRHPTGAFVLRGNAVADAGAEDSPGYADVRAHIAGGMLITTQEDPHDNTIPRNAAIPTLAPPIVPIWRQGGARVRTGPDAGAMATDSAADQGIADEAGQVPPTLADAPPVPVATVTQTTVPTAQAKIQQVSMQGAVSTPNASGDGSADTDTAGNPVDPGAGETGPAGGEAGAAAPDSAPGGNKPASGPKAAGAKK